MGVRWGTLDHTHACLRTVGQSWTQREATATLGGHPDSTHKEEWPTTDFLRGQIVPVQPVKCTSWKLWKKHCYWHAKCVNGWPILILGERYIFCISIWISTPVFLSVIWYTKLDKTKAMCQAPFKRRCSFSGRAPLGDSCFHLTGSYTLGCLL